MKKGDLVKVYQKPFTQDGFEGRATLMKRIKDDDVMEYWEVRFKDEPKTIYSRWIRAKA